MHTVAFTVALTVALTISIATIQTANRFDRITMHRIRLLLGGDSALSFHQQT